MVHNLDRKKDDDDGRGWNPFHNLEKTVVLQEARVFNETPLQPRACLFVLTKILYLLNQGQQRLATAEATDAFFAMTRLFQSNDLALRSLCYLAIKEMAGIDTQNVIMVTSSLTRDVTGGRAAAWSRGAAIRALGRVTEASGSTLQDVERYVRQAMVDRAPGVSSSALVTSLHMVRRARREGSCDQAAKHWVNEAQEAAASGGTMVQYHALGLLYQLRRSDRTAVAKMLGKMTQDAKGPRSPFACCLLIRVASKLLRDEAGGEERHNPALAFMESCLRHRNDMVVYEAASAVIHLPNECPRNRKLVAAAVSVLQMFCSSTRATLRFAAVRTFNKVASRSPSYAVMLTPACSGELEKLMGDSNGSVAMLAVTTLLQTVQESGVEPLVKQAAAFVSECRSEEFKVSVVRAVGALCRRYPAKNGAVVDVLAGMLKDHGYKDFEYKRAIVDAIVGVVEEEGNAACNKEAALAHLCEYIEDCGHPALLTRILHLLGKEGPRSPQPSQYIRHIFNRVALESEAVRAAAVSALAKFAAAATARGGDDELLPGVLALLRRCTLDGDDEVRDRAVFYLDLLEPREEEEEQERRALSATYISGSGADDASLCCPTLASIPELERSLRRYIAEPSEEPFDMTTVPLEAAAKKHLTETASTSKLSKKSDVSSSSTSSWCQEDIHRQGLAGIPEFHTLGPLFKSSEALCLTEAETEYVVRCVKHVFAADLVLEFLCENTLDDRVLLNALVQVEPQEEGGEGGGYEVLERIAAPSLACGRPVSCYTRVRLPGGLQPNVHDEGTLDDDAIAAAANVPSACTFSCTLKYLERPCDPATGEATDAGYEDEYILEDLELTPADHFLPKLPEFPDFESAWKELGAEQEREETLALGSSAGTTLDQAVASIVGFLGLAPCEGTADNVSAKKSFHVLLLSGVFRGGHEVLVRARLARLAGQAGVTMRVTVRSRHAPAVEIILASMG